MRTVTCEDIQIFLQDYEEVNRLTGKLMFTPDRVQKAVEYAIDDWNETPPFTIYYKDADFPYRNCLFYGVLRYLFEGEASIQDRNNLPYSSGGLSVNDSNNGQTYRELANRFGERFQSKMQMLKYNENLDQGWGTFSSGYYGGRR